MCNISKDDAIGIGKHYQTATDKEIIAAHRSLNTFVDQAQANTYHRPVLHDELQGAKAWKVLLQQEMLSRNIESSARPARQLAA